MIPFKHHADIAFYNQIREILVMKKLLTLEESQLPNFVKLYDYYVNKDDQTGEKYLVLVLELCDCNLNEIIEIWQKNWYFLL